MPEAPQPYRALPRSIWALGLVSMCMDISSELVHSLLPLFMVGTLGASVAMVGLVEGIAEATAHITKIFSGSFSDFIGRRKPVVLAGYALAALSKPLFPLAGTLGLVMGARFIDRVGKGIRGAPRDALITDIVETNQRGAAFGLRQSLDTIGAVIGPLLAIGGMMLFMGDLRAVLWVAVVPAMLSVAVLAMGVEEPEIKTKDPQKYHRIQFKDMRHIGKGFWYMMLVAGIMTLARFSEAFLLLKAQTSGVTMALVPLVMVCMNVIYAATAYPIGKWSDRIGRKYLLLGGLLLLMLADIVLANATTFLWVLAGVVLWGLHMGLSQGLLSAMVADSARADLRGTAFGIYNFICGIAMLFASIVAGILWDTEGAAITFYAGAAFAVTAFGLLAVRKQI